MKKKQLSPSNFNYSGIFSLLIVILILSAVSSCKKEDDVQDMNEIEVVNTSVKVVGIVTDEQGQTLGNADISMNGEVATTESNGIFILESAPVLDGFNFIKALKPGYYHGGKVISPNGNEINVSIVMKSRSLLGSIDATSGGELTTNEGLKVTLPANSIEGGYNGLIQVYADYIDPTEISEIAAIPGMIATDTNDETVILQSFGMGIIELEDGNGNALQLEEGVEAEIVIPVPSDLVGNAPNEIPLWYFDEEIGLWIEEGNATLQGSDYTGTVSHFTPWNVDLPFCVEVGVFHFECDGTPLAGLNISIQSSDGPQFISAITDEDGNFSAMVPCDQIVNISLIGLSNEVCEIELGSLDLVGGNDFVIDLECDQIFSESVTVNGSAIDCEGQPLTEGYVIVDSPDGSVMPVFLDDDGGFSVVVVSCQSSNFDVEITIIDTEQGLSSDPLTIQSSAGEIINLNEPLQVCDEIEFVNRIYVAFADATFKCLDLNTGNDIWSVDQYTDEALALVTGIDVVIGAADGIVSYGPSGEINWENTATRDVDLSPFNFVDGLILETNSELYNAAYVQAMNANSGNVVWQYFHPGSNPWDLASWSPVVYNNMLIWSVDDQLLGNDVYTGNLLWEGPSDVSGIAGPCLVGNDLIYLNDSECKLVSYDLETQTQNWIMDDIAGMSSPTYFDGKVFVSNSQDVRAIDINTGSEIWSSDLFEFCELGNSAFYYENKIYFKSLNSTFYCLDASNGSELWTKSLSHSASSPVVVNNVAYVGSGQGVFYALNASTGDEIWTRQFFGVIGNSCAVVDGNGVVHYPSISGMRQ